MTPICPWESLLNSSVADWLFSAELLVPHEVTA